MCDIFNLRKDATSDASNLDTGSSSKEGESRAKAKLDNNVASSESKETDDDITLDKIDSVFTELQKWADISDSKVYTLC